jgi:uncharacterized protein
VAFNMNKLTEAARGEMGPDSDLDFLVVMPEGTHRRRTAQRLYRELVGSRQPFDVLVRG